MAKKILPKEYARILYELTAGQQNEKKLDAALGVYCGWLRQEHAVNKLKYIVEAFIHYAKERTGLTQVELHTARALSERTCQQLARQLGDMVEVTNRVDRGIIGGVIVRIGNTIMNGSVKKQLEKLRQQLR